MICCLPERLELVRTVIQRAQAIAKHGAVIAVVSDTFDVDAVQGCAIRPGYVFRLSGAEDGDLALDVSGQNDKATRERATEVLAMFSAASTVGDATRPAEPVLSEQRQA